MAKITIDQKQIEVEPGATILDAARKAGVDIPTLCFLDGHTPETSCMVCVVKVKGSSRLVPSCATKAEDGMVVESSSEDVIEARRTALELLLGDHIGDCIGPCQSVCPAHMDIPTMISHIAEGRLNEAIVTIKERIALPATLGRICPEVSEKGCRRGTHDAAVSICQLKRFAADADLASENPYIPPRKPDSEKRIAIIGAGPAGLSAAYYLLQDGHSCTVFDDHDLPGGTLRYALTPEQLPRDVLDAEIRIINELGMEFRQNNRIECIEDIRSQYNAVLLATGTITEDITARLGLKWSGRGVLADKLTHETSIPGVFAAGSAVSPTHLAVRSVADGRCTALAISAYLSGEHFLGNNKPFTVHIGHLTEAELQALTNRANLSGRLMATEDGYTAQEAIDEAKRCLHCECTKLTDCRLKRYAEAYGASPTKYKGERRPLTREMTHPDVVYEPGKCISCGLCIRIAEKAHESLGLTFIGRGFRVQTAVPFDESLAQGLKITAEECAKACPTAAISMKHKTESE